MRSAECRIDRAAGGELGKRGNVEARRERLEVGRSDAARERELRRLAVAIGQRLLRVELERAPCRRSRLRGACRGTRGRRWRGVRRARLRRESAARAGAACGRGRRDRDGRSVSGIGWGGSLRGRVLPARYCGAKRCRARRRLPSRPRSRLAGRRRSYAPPACKIIPFEATVGGQRVPDAALRADTFQPAAFRLLPPRTTPAA